MVTGPSPLQPSCGRRVAARVFWRSYTGTTQTAAGKSNGLEAEAANPLIPFLNFGGLGRNRTTDTRIFNPRRIVFACVDCQM